VLALDDSSSTFHWLKAPKVGFFINLCSNDALRRDLCCSGRFSGVTTPVLALAQNRSGVGGWSQIRTYVAFDGVRTPHALSCTSNIVDLMASNFLLFLGWVRVPPPKKSRTTLHCAKLCPTTSRRAPGPGPCCRGRGGGGSGAGPGPQSGRPRAPRPERAGP